MALMFECMQHPGRTAAWYCPACDALLCDPCLAAVTITADANGPHLCPYCGGRMKTPDPSNLQARRERQQARQARKQAQLEAQQQQEAQHQAAQQQALHQRALQQQRQAFQQAAQHPEGQQPHQAFQPQPTTPQRPRQTFPQPAQPAMAGSTTSVCLAAPVLTDGQVSSEEFMASTSYPFHGRGRGILFAGVAAYTFIGVIQSMSMVVGTLGILITGYTMSYLMKVINVSASGQNEPPDWPALTDYSNAILVPFVRWVTCVVVAFFLPIALEVNYLVSSFADPPSEVVMTFLVILGALYLPMALLSVSLLGSFTAAGPHRVLIGIIRVGAPYWAVAGPLAVIMAVAWLIKGHLTRACLESLGPVIGSAVAYSIGGFVVLYSLMVVGRALGLLYLNYSNRLKWFDN